MKPKTHLQKLLAFLDATSIRYKECLSTYGITHIVSETNEPYDPDDDSETMLCVRWAFDENGKYLGTVDVYHDFDESKAKYTDRTKPYW